MKPTSRKIVLWAAGTLLFSIAAYSAGQQEMSKGEIIMNAACLTCHNMRPINMTAQDSEGWKKIVDSMVEKGAPVKKEEIPDLVEYLTHEHGPLPNGAGRAIMLDVCTHCHDLDRIRETKLSREEWEDTLVHMIGEGAELSDDDFPVLLNYLARNFRAEN